MRQSGLGRVAFALLAVGLAGPAALAQRYSLRIEDVPLTLVDSTGQRQTIDLGDVSVTLSNRGGSGMSAVFRVADEHRPDQGGGELWAHLELHWVNIITDDACPATVRGVPAGRGALPFPVVDMPRNGWDYVYRSRRSSRGRGPDRTETNADGREMRDDARDIWPWYHTPEEELMQPTSGNEAGGFGQFRHGVVYGIRDLPSLCGGGGVTAFTTLLVAVVPSGQDGNGSQSLQQGQLLVLAGFDWDWTSEGLRLEETAFTVEQLDRALHHSEFQEWMGAEAVPVYVRQIIHAGGAPEDGSPAEPAAQTPRRLDRKPKS